MSNPKYRLLVTVLVICCMGAINAQAKTDPPCKPTYRKYFAHFVDNRSLTEKSLNLMGMSARPVGRSFALLCYVSRYDHLQDLPPAEIDMQKMKQYLLEQEFFDEIVVLGNNHFSHQNLRYFLQSYFPQRVEAIPNSRFLFAFSGHGADDGHDGYLLAATAKDMNDFEHAVDLGYLRVLIQKVVKRGHQILALINSCYGGDFLSRSFSQPAIVPGLPGAHGITAGNANQLVWSDPEVGAGSVFFETLLAGLNQHADTLPPAASPGGAPGDGIITVDELASWLKASIIRRSQALQSPNFGNLGKEISDGGFFFLNRRKQYEGGVTPPWQPDLSFGGIDPEDDTASPPAVAPVHPPGFEPIGQIDSIDAEFDLIFIKLSRNIPDTGVLIVRPNHKNKVELKINKASDAYASANAESGMHLLSPGDWVYMAEP